MTEKQIQNLKQLLSNSVTADSPKELDDKILKAAKLHAEQLDNAQKQSLSSQFFNNVDSLGKFGAGALSIILTAALFLSLSHMLNVDPQSPSAQYSSDSLTRNDSDTETELLVEPSGAIQKTAKPWLIQPPQNQPAHDQILVDIELPRASDILATVDFDIEEDRSLAENLVNIAMNDIRQHIGVGQLSKARQRYAELREMCASCTLPDTLETLVLNTKIHSEHQSAPNSS